MKNKFNLKKLASFTVILAGILGTTVGLGQTPVQASELVKVPVEQQLIQGLPRGYSSNEFIIAHESGNPNNTGANSLYNEVGFMKNNWQSAFVTHWVGSGGKVIQLAPTGYASWGAGAKANGRAYAQVELARANNKTTFMQDYVTYVNLMRQLANEAKIPVTLDTTGNGIKSHQWVTNNLGGTDHSDPYSYLASFGISKEQFAKDIANGFSDNPAVPEPSKPQPSADTYTVKAGDTLSGVGKTTGKKWQDIAALNSIKAPYIIQPKQLLKITGTTVTPAPKPPVPVPAPTETGWVKETGRYFPNTTVNIRNGASTSNAVVGQYHAGESVVYDSYKVSGGYVWIHYISYNGQNRYMAIRKVGQPIWGFIQ